MPSEREQIEWIRSQVANDPRVAVGIGDDCAVLKAPAGKQWLITADMILEGVHFDRSTCSARAIGFKAMNVNISDIAAMAGEPVAAIVTVGLPRDADEGFARELFFGIQDAARRFDVAIVGGDTNRSRNGLVVSVTLLGQPTGSGAVLRSGARPNDVLFVTGRLGYSLQGRHLCFTPRVAEAQRLHERYGLHAMIDLSDGLGNDLFHILSESGVGATLDAAEIPVHLGQSDGRSALDHALNDGEDFELLFAVSPDSAENILRDRPLADLGVELTRIGVVTESREVWMRFADGLRTLQRGGFEHEW